MMYRVGWGLFAGYMCIFGWNEHLRFLGFALLPMLLDRCNAGHGQCYAMSSGEQNKESRMGTEQGGTG